MSKFITRKEIAAMLDVTVDVVRKNEAEWGLIEARLDFNKRMIRYQSLMVRRILMSKGWIRSS